MALQLLITWGGVERDYTRYVDQTSVQITEKINVPTQFSALIYPLDGAFIVPPTLAYVKLWSQTNQRSLFTGFLTNTPVRSFLAKDGRQTNFAGQLFSYSLSCTSDDYLLGTKAVTFIPAFVNRTQGEILADLADILCPGFFDTSLCASGDIVPYFAYDHTQTWPQIAKTFGDGSRYRYKVRDKKIFYVPYGDDQLGISYDDQLPYAPGGARFSPKDLKTTILTVPLVNDVTIIGDIEAGNSREDYFIGDGFTGNFPLLHKVFRGASSLLLQDSWTETTINTQQWYLQDPADNFQLTTDGVAGLGALNLVTPPSTAFPALGDSYIAMNNGVELAGGLVFDHGEFSFNDYCSGVVGGIYTDSNYTAGSLLAGFNLSSPGSIVTSASGAAGIHIQPSLSGSLVGPVIVTQTKHTYVLQTTITAPQYTRYQQVYRTIEGEAFGGGLSQLNGLITFTIQDYDIAAATGFYYQPTITQFTIGSVLPAFATYSLINNLALNLSVANTTIALMVPGTLAALEGPSGLWWPSGLILPMLPVYSGGFIGPVLPWPNSASAGIYPGPLPLTGGLNNLVIGNGFQLQAAQITPGNEADILGFYAQTLPAAGTPIWFQSWESQAAVSRLQVSGSIIDQQYIVGDDGIRSAIVSDLNPLPRTSEDCDNAALAFLADRVNTFYSGSYSCTDLFLNQTTEDVTYYPTCGRFLNVNSPARGIYKQPMLVSGVTISLLEMYEERLKFDITFGADLHLEKVLKNFVDIQPKPVLTPQDTVTPPNPRYTINVNDSYLPDLQATHIDMGSISPSLVTVVVYDNYTGPIEVRTQDTNWGGGPSFNYVGTFAGPYFQLKRTQYDQQWFMRPVQDGLTSRRSKVLRVRYPVTPASPIFVSQASSVMQFAYNGDMRNIYGFEIRFELASGATLVALQKPVSGSYSDLNFDVLSLPFTQTPDYHSSSWTMYAYFFTTNWQYSDPTVVTVSIKPPAGDGYYTITPAGGHAVVDLSNGLNQRLVLNASAVTIDAPLFSGGSIVAGSWVTLYLDQDATGSRAIPTFAGGVGGFVSNTGTQIQMDPTPNTRTALTFTYHGSYWSLDSQQTGAAIS
jgi:hypothetical protein